MIGAAIIVIKSSFIISILEYSIVRAHYRGSVAEHHPRGEWWGLGY